MATAFKKVLLKKKVQEKQEDSDLEGSQSSEGELASIHSDEDAEVKEEGVEETNEPEVVDPVSKIKINI